MNISQFIKNILSRKWYPAVLRWPTALFFVFLVYVLLYGRTEARYNLGLSMTWFLWWSILPLMFLVVGRFWCSICPFAMVNDLVQRLVGNNLPVPMFLKRYGAWITYLLFISLIYTEFILGIVLSTQISAILMLTLATFAVISGAFYTRRTWCRYLCPLGGMATIFSKAGMIELKAQPSICAKCKSMGCYKGGENTPGCPVFLVPRISENQPANCTYCGNCVKNCPNDSISIEIRPPTRGLWFLQKPKLEESFLAALFIGVGLSLSIMLRSQHWAEGFLGIKNLNLSIAALYVSVLAAPVLLLYAVSRFVSYRTEEPVSIVFARFGYFLIPLAFANQLAVATFHELLVNGKLSLYNIMEMIGLHRPQSATALVSMEIIKVFQILVLLAGATMSGFLAHRIAKSNYKGKQVTGAFIPFLLLLIFIVPCYFYFYFAEPEHKPTEHLQSPVAAMPSLSFLPPKPENAPTGIREYVLAGLNIMAETSRYAPAFTGNALSCTSCHFNSGMESNRKEGGISLVGVAAVYPKYTKRHDFSTDLVTRINDCFKRSLNGKALPVESKEMVSIVTYLTWISKDIPIYADVPWLSAKFPDTGHKPDPLAGRLLFGQKCAACHHMDGLGTKGAPPVWGQGSYNDGAGMSRLDRCAPFLLSNMPLDYPDLSPDQALDLCAFINGKPRPTFMEKI
ncbi:4Fe-4S binding protein [Candidatus Magnetominusculus dajiuhuensis]|uniref:4Fe-4S binding protein n=1 Tax=Candidatus Magnetominusculus dajiuhuensis TaxID=3137712 RepID=UPI003B4356E8